MLSDVNAILNLELDASVDVNVNGMILERQSQSTTPKQKQFLAVPLLRLASGMSVRVMAEERESARQQRRIVALHPRTLNLIIGECSWRDLQSLLALPAHSHLHCMIAVGRAPFARIAVPNEIGIRFEY